MLVTLANNQTIPANSSATYTYSPQSVQKVFISMEDADWEASKITVQIGATTICNGIMSFGLMGLTTLQCGVLSGSADGTLVLDFGSHVCQAQDNLYVTIQAVGEVANTDVSALVDEPGENFPVKLTEYSDNTFTSSNNLFALSYDSAQAEVNEDAYNVEIRTAISSSAPSFISANSYYKSLSINDDYKTQFGVLNSHSVPLKTTYNYNASAVTDRIITIEQMGTSRAQVAQARRSAQLAVSQAGK
jgi:hypothetical protein